MLLSMEAGDRESACRSTETAILEFSSGNLPKLVPWRDKERVGITVDAEAGGEEDGVPGDPAIHSNFIQLPDIVRNELVYDAIIYRERK